MGAGQLKLLSFLLLGLVCTSAGCNREQLICSLEYQSMQVVRVVEPRGRVCIFKHSKIGCKVRGSGRYQPDLNKDLGYCSWLWEKPFVMESPLGGLVSPLLL